MNNIVLVGIPYDSKSSFMRGPSTAPQFIRECLYSSSTNMFAENGLSIKNDKIKDYGDIAIKKYFEISDSIGKLLAENNRIVSFGGDHSISYPILKAYSNFHSDIDPSYRFSR